MPGQSLRILIALVVIAIMFSGWIAGWQCRRENADMRKQLEGTAFTQEEQILIDLQDQLGAVRAENAQLSAELEKLRAEQEPAAETESPEPADQ